MHTTITTASIFCQMTISLNGPFFAQSPPHSCGRCDPARYTRIFEYIRTMLRFTEGSGISEILRYM